MRTKALLGTCIVTLGVLLAGSPQGSAATTTAAVKCPLPRFGPGATYHPRIVPARFSPHVTNPWYPLRVGTTYFYVGVDSGIRAVDVVVVTRHTRVIDGVRTRVVADRLYEAGRLSEKTTDYFAQDVCGNVWYFGEDTVSADDSGRLTDHSGTWHAGVDGAQPGVFMQAHPELGRRFRQEWYRGEAEDTFVVRDLSTPVTVPAGAFRHALRTEETTHLEPGVIDNKYYVQGIGDVKEVTVQGGHERFVLREVIG